MQNVLSAEETNSAVCMPALVLCEGGKHIIIPYPVKEKIGEAFSRIGEKVCGEEIKRRFYGILSVCASDFPVQGEGDLERMSAVHSLQEEVMVALKKISNNITYEVRGYEITEA